MSYQVLARKWRPKRFSELVGQEHVVRALTNALESGRVHHAFLFSGTRGVGKTTIARIFAKSLNCERGLSANPCGECSACLDIDAGRFVDLIEIDAASNTGVDNVRDLIENAQYTPARGQHKVYLIDEVHMLSKPAFNALLKTLEEPPPHVKFLLATTDPQKLPVTVLSRCLKFNLKRLSTEQIAGQINLILTAEGIHPDADAVRQLARAADGSLRDGLSLLDQAIAYGAGTLRAAEVGAMLGTIERGEIYALVEAIATGSGPQLLTEIDRIAEFSPDFGVVLDELATILHNIQIKQLVPNYENTEYSDSVTIDALASRLAPEEVQLYYQLAITGRRDMNLAPSMRMGFEMTLLRMLAFRPVGEAQTPRPQHRPESAEKSVAQKPVRMSSPPIEKPKEPVAEATSSALSEPIDIQNWPALIEAAKLRGPVGQLAQHAAFIAWEGNTLRLALKAAHEHLNTPVIMEKMQQQLEAALKRPVKLRFEKADAMAQTPADSALLLKSEQQRGAQENLNNDPLVQSLMQNFGARIIPESIKPMEKEA